MLSRIKKPTLSTKLSIINAGILITTLIVMSILSIISIYFALYQQGKNELKISMEHVQDIFRTNDSILHFTLNQKKPLTEQKKSLEYFLHLLYARGIVLPGVILRITDENDRLIFGEEDNYPSIEEIEQKAKGEKSIFSCFDNDIILSSSYSLYMDFLPFTFDKLEYRIYFLKIITSERYFLKSVWHVFLIFNICAIILAIIWSYIMTQRTLLPIRKITQEVREMKVASLDHEIIVPRDDADVEALAETFNRMFHRMSMAFDQQRRFVSDASHELRTPVTVMRGYVDILLRWGKDDKKILSEAISAIKSEVDTIEALIKRLLFLARADQQRQILNLTKINLAHLIQDIARELSIIDKEHEFTVLRNDAGFIYADEIMFKEMLRIFLDNSIKYTPAHGKITLSSMKKGNFFYIQISDTGIGISKDDQEKLFERFFRADTSRSKTKVNGTGLGLSIAKFIADANNISLAIKSELDKGTDILLKIKVLAEMSPNKESEGMK